MNERELLPAWGPYSKKYMGISHVPDTDSLDGARFDFVVFPTLANSGNPVPNVTVPSGYHPWNGAGDLSFWEYRFELEWKDRVYADVSFTHIDPDTVLVRTEFQNTTELGQNCVLNYFCAMEYPFATYCRPQLPEKHTLVCASHYSRYEYRIPRPWDAQNPDGARKGVFRDADFVDAFGLGDRVNAQHIPQCSFHPFGAEQGDRVSFCLEISQAYDCALLGVRYRTIPSGDGPSACGFAVGGIVTGELFLPESAELRVHFHPVGALAEGSGALDLTALGSPVGVELDCLFLVEKTAVQDVAFLQCRRDTMPRIDHSGNTVSYRYEGAATPYEVTPLTENCRFRLLETGSLEDALISRLSNYHPTFDDVLEPFTQSFRRKHTNDGVYHNILVHTLFLDPNSSQVEYAIVSSKKAAIRTSPECEAIYRAHLPGEQPLHTGGVPYAFSNRLLKSTLLSNVVYPIYRYGKNIKHFTPGKRWDCLYTWDSAFIGLGFLEINPCLAEYMLDTYLVEPGNPDFAFLFHGSPVPVQAYLLLELLNRNSDRKSLERYYPRARQFYRFLTGKTNGSTTARFRSGLLSTYDLFYNSSGMDDYPAQSRMHAAGLARNATPCIATSHAIRFGKILKMLAAELELEADMGEYDSDIDRMVQGLQQYAWDPADGYFGYVLHDDAWNPTGVLRSKEGENLNKGFDGVYPLITGECTAEQEERLLAHLQSPEELMSPVGLSAVDQSAGYFHHTGYWNGCVWFAHQWFFFKTMLDLGQADFAHQIAQTALEVWKREVEATYCCFEMIHIATQRGGWYHQFGGLSSPVLLWYHTYWIPGTITGGFELRIHRRHFQRDFTMGEIHYTYYGKRHGATLIVVMSDKLTCPYSVEGNDGPVPYTERNKGVLELRLTASTPEGIIRICPSTPK